MDEILHADDTKLAKSSLDQVVGGDGSAVAIDLRDDVKILKVKSNLSIIQKASGQLRILFNKYIYSKLEQ